MHKGSCLCGRIRFEVLSEPKNVTHCHCRMCQKQHGAAFATYASVRRKDFVYLSGQELLTAYDSSETIRRRFCRICGSNLEWSGSPQFPDWVSFTLACLDTPFQAKETRSIHEESRACWLDTL